MHSVRQFVLYVSAAQLLLHSGSARKLSATPASMALKPITSYVVLLMLLCVVDILYCHRVASP